MNRIIRRALPLAALAVLPLAVQAAELDTQEKKFSYTLGYQFGQQMKQDGIKVDAAAFAAGIDDVLSGNDLQLSLDEMRAALKAGREALQKEQQQKEQAALAAGKAYREKNAGKEGVVTLPSGLQYKVLREGKGTPPAADAKVTVNYRGTLIDGTEFDSSYKRGKPTTFSLDRVIPGFREAITRMKPGAKWQVVMPPELAYGSKGAGTAIGPNETLLFEIELLPEEKGK
ncbi:MAG TPA: FKBP-type peptidyl-prolyl cis-trans isomerase [Sedimenticola thiotaurini]|uniref:Peptidyl-prolyl cis-trans isomerase n=1 Tax=Sedimenticola thiotaurini TaxID=1543721 RepID=A0A831RMP2_9GAMM|nr:FKBP-type peptidyl-prolyl cis-trans isomerase [Sedimenticola thiotaurini]